MKDKILIIMDSVTGFGGFGFRASGLGFTVKGFEVSDFWF